MIQTHAFVLRSEPVGEMDRRYSLLTQEFGKIEAVAKAVRKNTAKLAGHLEPVNFVWVSLIESKAGYFLGKQVWQIAQALEEESFTELRTNPGAFRAALGGALVLDDFLAGHTADDAVFLLWSDYIAGLTRNARNEAVKFNPEFFLAEFIIRVVAILGLLSDPGRCAECGSTFGKNGAYFHENHFLCEICGTRQKSAARISSKTLGVFAVIGKGVWLPESSEGNEIVFLSREVLRRARALTR